MSDSRLTAGIRQILTWCFDHPGKRRKYATPGGMTVILYIDLAGRRHVCLSRRGDVGPSLQEAKTVLAHWPEPAPAPAEVMWTPAKLGKFSVLVSIWKVPAAPQQLQLEPNSEESARE